MDSPVTFNIGEASVTVGHPDPAEQRRVAAVIQAAIEVSLALGEQIECACGGTEALYDSDGSPSYCKACLEAL